MLYYCLPNKALDRTVYVGNTTRDIRFCLSSLLVGSLKQLFWNADGLISFFWTLRHVCALSSLSNLIISNLSNLGP